MTSLHQKSVHQERIKPVGDFLAVITALNFHQCFDAAEWGQKGSWPVKTCCTNYPQGSFGNRQRRGSRMQLATSGSPGKWQLKQH